jgi:uncharacterized protein (TIGR02145 family)
MTSTTLQYAAKAKAILGIFIFMFAYQACETIEAENPLLMSIDHMEFESEGSYKITGTLASLGDNEITGFGICWNETEKPDIEGSLMELVPPFSTGEFSLTVSGLSASTSYYFRAFAEMKALTVYSEEKAFTTRPAAENMVMDADGNIYKIVKIGAQTLMAENLKVTKYADKSPIPHVQDKQEWFDFIRESEAYCWYDNVLTHGYVYGALYTWPAAVGATKGSDLIPSGIQGVCPDGWHLPSDGEWKQLETYLGMSQEDADALKWRGTDQGSKLKKNKTEHWTGPNVGATDEVQFSALPGGQRHGSGEFMDLNQSTRIWTASGNGYGYGWFRELANDKASISRDFYGVYSGYSVRCVKD